MMKPLQISLRRRLGALALGLAFALGAGAGGSAAQDKVLRVVPHADLKNHDPIWTTAYITRNHGYMVYDTLVRARRKPETAAADG